MSNTKLLINQADVLYKYDGSIKGFYCCVYESVYTKEMPAAIFAEYDAEPTFFREKYIDTDPIKAQKVRNSVKIKISAAALELIECVFLSCLKMKETAILRFLLLGYEHGAKTLGMLNHPDVSVLMKAQKHLLGEAHLLLGFIRFADYDGKMLAVISPKNFILPFISNHFISRFSGEDFMIYDKTNKAALIYKDGKKSIIAADAVELSEITREEEMYSALWKQFYKTISIEERYNPKCRMTHMPKRYWENMTEMK